MKIIRFASANKEIFYGVFSPDRPDFAKIIEGNIPGNYKITSREEKISQWLPPIIPLNILALGINYKKHGDETAMSCPDQPILFIKATSSITGHNHPVVLPATGPDMVDYEAELAVVVGKSAKNIKPDQAMDHIFGYSCAMTLLPGTVILTGTPEGVGFTRQPPLFLQPGDVISVEIENIGTLTNQVIKES